MQNKDDNDDDDDHLQTYLNNVNDGMMSTQAKIHFFNGDVMNNNQQENHIIETEPSNSYVFVNIQNKNLIFSGKFNHLIVTKCKNLKLTLIKAISGIDIMNTTNININVQEFDYISFFSCSNVNVKSSSDETTSDGIIELSSCLDVFYNNRQLRCNPYINIAHRNGEYEFVPSSLICFI